MEKNKIELQNTAPTTRGIVDGFLRTFKGNNKQQRGNAWNLQGSGTSFLTSTAIVNNSIAPSANNTYALGDSGAKWSNIWAVLINGVTPKSGSHTYYVAPSSGASPTTAITFNTGILE